VRTGRRFADGAEQSSHDATVITLTSPSGHEESYAARVAWRVWRWRCAPACPRCAPQTSSAQPTGTWPTSAQRAASPAMNGS